MDMILHLVEKVGPGDQLDLPLPTQLAREEGPASKGSLQDVLNAGNHLQGILGVTLVGNTVYTCTYVSKSTSQNITCSAWLLYV